MQKGRMDKTLLWTTIILVAYGFITFFSAALGELTREGEAAFFDLVRTQAIFGVIGGFLALFITSKIPPTFWKKYALWVYLFAAILTLLVFTGLGYSHGGATRWLDLGVFSFQPAEVLKLAFIIYFAAWSANVGKNIRALKHGLLPLGVMFGISAVILLAQPDIDTLIIMGAAAVGVFLVAGAQWKHLGVILGVGMIVGALLIAFVPYVNERVETFLNPGTAEQGAGYQIQQSLIAVSSGELFGRGLGQSLQKFNYLPEPVGDSVFAVLAEELGFLGGLVLIGLFAVFAWRGFFIAARTRDDFGRLLATGIVILIVTQAFLNIASILGVFPLAGLPLPFVSHGGSALLISLGMVGILLSISRTAKKRKV